jgi:hypothetical protein
MSSSKMNADRNQHRNKEKDVSLNSKEGAEQGGEGELRRKESCLLTTKRRILLTVFKQG